MFMSYMIYSGHFVIIVLTMFLTISISNNIIIWNENLLVKTTNLWIVETIPSHIFTKPEVKTEEGYSADIYPWRYTSALCPHNVRTMSAQHLPRETYILREMLCGHSADIVRTYISRDICPHNVRTISFFGFQLRNERLFYRH